MTEMVRHTFTWGMGFPRTTSKKFDKELQAALNYLIKEWFTCKGIRVVKIHHDAGNAQGNERDQVYVVTEIPAKDFFISRLAGKENALENEVQEYLLNFVIGAEAQNAP